MWQNYNNFNEIISAIFNNQDYIFFIFFIDSVYLAYICKTRDRWYNHLLSAHKDRYTCIANAL